MFNKIIRKILPEKQELKDMMESRTQPIDWLYMSIKLGVLLSAMYLHHIGFVRVSSVLFGYIIVDIGVGWINIVRYQQYLNQEHKQQYDQLCQLLQEPGNKYKNG